MNSTLTQKEKTKLTKSSRQYQTRTPQILSKLKSIMKQKIKIEEKKRNRRDIGLFLSAFVLIYSRVSAIFAAGLLQCLGLISCVLGVVRSGGFLGGNGALRLVVLGVDFRFKGWTNKGTATGFFWFGDGRGFDLFSVL